MPKNFNKNRILKNSLLLYLRMLFTMWLNLYATRLVLNNLGVEDMGVYGVVGSIVGMFTIFTSGITSAVQRFLTYELGSQKGNMNNVFCSSLNVIFILAFCVLLLLEIIGVWVLYHKINIPTSSMQAAFWVFQLSTLTCIINMISIPYNALIIAHEKMDAFAFISILQVILNCSAAYCLSFISNERLLMYGIMMAGISILIRIIYQLYCHSHFKETHYHWKIDPELLKSISKFAGISTSSSILQMISTQGITFVINWTFGVTINAVYVIALQLKNSILSFALNLLKANDKITLRDIELKVLSPTKDYQNSNNNSLVILANLFGKKYLFTGDITKVVEEKIELTKDDVDILKVAHHGSNTSSSLSFLNKIGFDISNPNKIAICMNGYLNQFSFPHSNTVYNIQTKLYITSYSKTICIRKNKLLSKYNIINSW